MTGRHRPEHLLMRGVSVKTFSVLLSPEKYTRVERFFAQTGYALAVMNQESLYAS